MQRFSGHGGGLALRLSILFAFIAILSQPAPVRAGLGWHIELAGEANPYAAYTHLALDSTGQAAIALIAAQDNRLHLLLREKTGWSDTPINGVTCESGTPPALIYGSDGLPRLACGDLQGDGAHFLRWNGTAWVMQKVIAGQTAARVSLALGADDTPHLVFWARSLPQNGIWYARQTDTGWQAAQLASCLSGACLATTVETTGNSASAGYWYGATLAYHPSPESASVPLFSQTAPGSGALILRYDQEGQAWLLFQASGIKLARWDGSSAQVETLPLAGSLPAGDLRFNADGDPCLLHAGAAGLALACLVDGDWHTEIIAPGNLLPGSLAFDQQGYAHLSYSDPATGAVYYTTNAPLLPPVDPPSLFFLPLLVR